MQATWLQRTKILEQVTKGPNLWEPLSEPSPHSKVALTLIDQLWELTEQIDSVGMDWRIRFSLIRLMRKAFLRRSFLPRVLGSDLSDTDRRAEALVKRFYEPFSGTEESLAVKFSSYINDIIETQNTESREQMLIASLAIRQPISLVEGETKQSDRTRYFLGFNGPLLPEILVCTSVGQKGINLHRFCRKIVHYDIPFNPATLEQRTGRIDRIGSKAFHDREIFGKDIFLEVKIPYVAATYDEKIFNDMRKRAQTFEILTGGDPAGDVSMDENPSDSPGEENLNEQKSLIDLPEKVLKDLRVDLAVYNPQSS